MICRFLEKITASWYRKDDVGYRFRTEGNCK